ncbi:unnamed protein product [Adineta steineri]|uniref:Uncharacterized protein n=1 Tax=Adineta steineri TaxID=433720 RepID=A0A813X0P1_9BILA|nr:unnamed protein product [Adineta steineri]CAF1627846.1 unnamed protein product [Adineta steineri]
MTTRPNPQISYSAMHNNNNDDQLFSDDQIARYDADTIKNRYGDNWRNYASNIREIKQADGTIVREYIIEDPTLLREIKPTLDSTSSTTGSDDEQRSSKNKFAQIKAKFEQKSLTNVMGSPSSSSPSSNTTTITTRRNSSKQSNDLYERNHRRSNDTSSSNHRTNVDLPPPPHPVLSNTSSSNANSVQSKISSHQSMRRLNSADEADEEVHRIHRESQELRQRHNAPSPVPQINNPIKQQPNVQYEVIDEDGNPMVIDDVHDLIKMSGVTAREVKQPNGTILREYVIDDPEILSKFRSQQQSPTMSQQRNSHDNIPAPPPRVPLKQPTLFRQGSSNGDQSSPTNIQHVRVLEPQRRYEYVTTSGKRIEFMITNSGLDSSTLNDSDIREVATAINTRLLPDSSPASTIPTQPFSLPKQWHPAVDLTHRDLPVRQRIGSDNQPPRNTSNTAFHQVHPLHTELSRSASYGALNQTSYQQTFAPVFTEPLIDWSALQQQDPHGQIDPQLVKQFITQKHQSGTFQTSAQFLPGQQQQQQIQLPKQTPPQPQQQQQQQQQQMSRSAASSPQQNHAPIFYPQSMPYPYQGQHQHGVTLMTTDNNDSNQQHQHQHQQQATMINNGHTRI